MLKRTGHNGPHAQFHARMVHSAASRLEAAELEALLRSLSRLDQFFHDMCRQKQNTQ